MLLCNEKVRPMELFGETGYPGIILPLCSIFNVKKYIYHSTIYLFDTVLNIRERAKKIMLLKQWCFK